MMERYGDLGHWVEETARPYKRMFLDMEVKASMAEAELDPLSAADFRRKARLLKKHIERLEAM